MDNGLKFDELYTDLCKADSRALPAKYFTVRQFAADAGIPRSTSSYQLKDMAPVSYTHLTLPTILLV